MDGVVTDEYAKALIRKKAIGEKACDNLRAGIVIK